MDARDIYNLSLRIYTGLFDQEAQSVGMSAEDFIYLDEECTQLWKTLTLKNRDMLEEFVKKHQGRYEVLNVSHDYDDINFQQQELKVLLANELPFIT